MKIFILQRFNKIICALILFLISTSLCLVCGELTVRKLKLVPTTSIQAKRLSPNKLSYVPNSRWQYIEPEFSENVQINSIGYRDDDVNFEAPSIVFLGDSQTYGTGVQQGERASDLINYFLNTKCHSVGKKVVNISMPGASTRKELEMLNYAISKGLKVEHIFLMIVSNDHFQNYQEDVYESSETISGVGLEKNTPLKEKFVKRLRSLRYDSHLIVALLSALSEFNWFRHMYAESKILGGWGEILNTNILYYKNSKIQDQVLVTEKYIQQISNIAPTTLILVPDRYRFDPALQQMVRHSFIKHKIDDHQIDFDTEFKLIDEVSSANNLELLDPIDSFRSETRVENLYYPINGHLTNKGQALLAANIIKNSNYIHAMCRTEDGDVIDSELPTDLFQVSNEDPLDSSDDLL